MNDNMTVWAHRTQIIYGINSIGFTNVRKRLQVMHMNDISPNLTIPFFEIKTTNAAPSAIVWYCQLGHGSVRTQTPSWQSSPASVILIL